MVRVLEVNVDDQQSGGVYSLVKNVIENRGEGITIDIGATERFTSTENIRELEKLGAKIHYVGHNGNKLIKQIVIFLNLKKLLSKEKYECVHIHGDVANKLLVSGIAAKRAGMKRIILHSHAAGVDGNHRTLKRLFHKTSRIFLKYVGTDFVACSDLAASWMFPRIPQEKVTVIKNGIVLEKFRYNAEKRCEIRKDIKINSEILIGHVGRFAWQKNHDYLIDIMEKVRTVLPHSKLLLVGTGPEEDRIRQIVADRGLSKDVIFYGTSDRVHELYQAMDIFVLPSHFEGLPIVGVEAQAAGLPVLFSDLITKEAKLTDNVEYIAITKEAVDKWVDKIQDFSQMKRRDTYNELKTQGYDIESTVRSFFKLYRRSQREMQ